MSGQGAGDPTAATGTASHVDIPAALPRRRLVFVIVSLALFMASIDQTIVASALPAIQRDLGSSVNWTGWAITIYALGQVLTMPVAGKLSDQFGRKRVFLLAALLFTLASLACGFAENIGLLVVLRLVQAIGGGAFMPSATGIVADHFGAERDKAVGMFTSILPIGGIVGPILGGVFVTVWSWRGIFLVNIPIGITLIVLALLFIPHSKPRSSAPVDVRGILLLGGLIAAAMFGISYLGSARIPLYSPVFLVCELLAIGLVVLFVRHVRTHHAPFIPYRLLRERGFAVMNGINLIYGAAALGFGALVPLYAEQRFGMTSLQGGTLLTARGVGMIVVAALAAMAIRRTGHRAPMLGGFGVLAAGLVLTGLVPSGVSAYVWLSMAAALTGLGMGMSVPAANNASLQLAPGQVAAIAGLRGMFRQAGGITAISVTTAISARSADTGQTLAEVFLVVALLVATAFAMVFAVPDHRGNW